MSYKFYRLLVIPIGGVFSRILSGRVVSGSVFIALLFCAMTSLAVRPNNHNTITASAASVEKVKAVDVDASVVQPGVGNPRPAAQQTQRIQTEVIGIRRTGIEPASITRRQGRFILAVYNRSGLSEVELRLDRVGGNTLRLARVPREKLDWRSLEDLPPGEYTLSETKHPGWECSIKITP